MASGAAIALRVEAGPEVGFGHLARMFVLAAALRKRGVLPRFVLHGQAGAVRTEIEAQGFAVSEHDGARSTDWLDGGVQTVVYDLVHTNWHVSRKSLYAEIRAVTEAGMRIVFFDGYGAASYRAQEDAPALDVVIAPYVGEPGECRIRTRRVLAGPRYFTLADDYRVSERGGAPAEAKRVLVTCGGADPYSATPRILDALLDAPDRGMTIDVVVGAMFEDANRENIGARAARESGRVRLLDAPPSLARAMWEADLCVCANGLTKYELAAMGVPTLALSLTPAHHRANLTFAESGALSVVGLLDDIDTETVTHHFMDLAGHEARRQRMSQAGRSLVDGKGTDRILEEAGLAPC